MSITVKNLTAPVQLGTSITTHYTATNVRALIDKFTVCNTSAGAVTVDVHLVPSAGSATTTNQIIAARSLAVNETYTFPEIVGHVLESGSTIQANASAATAVSLRVSGREVTL